MRPFLVRCRAAALLAPWLLSACHGYAVGSVATVPADAPVRVELTDRATLDLATPLGPRARLVRGRVAERADSTLTLHVSSVTRHDGREESWRGEAVRMPLAAVARLEREQLSRARSGLLVGGVAAVVALAVAVFGGNGSESVRGGPGGQTPGGPR
jgi:hypothetical protein